MVTNVIAAALTLCVAGALFTGVISSATPRLMLTLQYTSMALCLACPLGLHGLVGLMLLRTRRRWLAGWLLGGPALTLLVVCPLAVTVAFWLMPVR